MSPVERAVVRGARWIAPIGAALAVCVFATVAVAVLPRPTSVTTHQTKRGKMLAAANGHTLYLFTGDHASQSSCTGSCASTWMPLLTSSRPVAVAGSGVNASLLGTISRGRGVLQVTYKGHPLYEFAQDKRAGQINGEGAHTFGGHWYVVSTAGNAVKPKKHGGTVVCHPLCQGY